MQSSNIFNSALVAQEVLDELRSFVAIAKPGEDVPCDAKLEEATRSEPLPTRDVFAKVLDEVFWASMLAEEGRFCRLRVTYCNRDFRPQSELAYRLRKPIELDRHSLRRLSFAHDYKSGDILWQDSAGEPRIVGIRIPWSGRESLGLRVRVDFPGKFDVTWLSQRLLVFNRGTILRFSTSRDRTFTVAEALAKLVFGENVKTLHHRFLLATILKQGHGGSVWIIGSGVEPAANIQIGYPIDAAPSVIGDIAPESKPRRWLDCLARFAGVDGAVVTDTNLRALGFGAFINMDGEDFALRWHPPESAERVRAAEIGGGRHRSAIAFCKQNAPALAYVISQDGRVSVVGMPSGDPDPLVAELVPLDYVLLSFDE